MQFAKPGVNGAYFADGNVKPWYKAMDDPGFNQMKYIKRLMLALPYFDRIPDQSVISGNGIRYERLIATRGKDYLLVYNHTGRDMTVDLRKISGKRKNVWWMNPANGALTYLGEHVSGMAVFRPHTDATGIADGVLIAIDSSKSYLGVTASEIPDSDAVAAERDRTE